MVINRRLPREQPIWVLQSYSRAKEPNIAGLVGPVAASHPSMAGQNEIWHRAITTHRGLTSIKLCCYRQLSNRGAKYQSQRPFVSMQANVLMNSGLTFVWSGLRRQ